MPELNKEYLSPKSGFLRFALIIVLLAAWISAAAAGVTIYSSNRDAFLAFAIIGFVLSIIIFVFNIFNLVEIQAISNIPWILIVNIQKFIIYLLIFLHQFAALDAIMLLAMFIVSIVIASTAGKTRGIGRKGAFISASIFGFISCVLYLVILIITALRIKNSGGVSNPRPSNSQQGSSETA